jgi:Uma2 family endonuclease
MRTKRQQAAQIEYPESDGKPMAESDFHRDWIVGIIELLKSFFLGKRVYVSGNLLIYYVEGNPKKSVAPDVFVVKNCDPRRRRIFKIWEEGVGPAFIMEVTSKKTRRQDLGTKKEIYAQLNVAEYFLYDPLAEWLKPALQGFRLVDGDYAPIERSEDGSLVSEQLGITFRLEDGDLALFNTATGQRLKSGAEQRAQEAEQRVQELEEELARLRAKRKE